MKLLGELKQYFLHIKLRVLLFSILPFIQHSSPKLYFKKTVPLGTDEYHSAIGWTQFTKEREGREGQKQKRTFGPSVHLPQIFFERRRVNWQMKKKKTKAL